MATTPRLERLARAVKERRAELGLAQGDLSDRGGPSIVTVGQIERAQIERPQAVTLARLDTALDWTRGSAAKVLAGGRATALDEDHPPILQRSSSLSDVIRAVQDDPDLALEAKEHLINQYGLLLRISTTPQADLPAGVPLRRVARKRDQPKRPT